jgi:predicted acetyltransferase
MRQKIKRSRYTGKEGKSMVKMRQLTHEDLDQNFALSQFAFQYERTAEELRDLKSRVKTDLIWGHFEDGKLLSKMTIVPFNTYINGKEFAMGGIASVATWPEYRRNGLVAKLLVHGLEVMRKQGQTISFLAPFSFSFYRKYGWEMHGEYKKYSLNVDQLPSFKGSSGRVKRVGQDINLLNRIYSTYASFYNGMLKRSDDWWTHTVFKKNKGTIAVYENAQGEPEGYLMYAVKNSEMTIHEFIHLDHDAYEGLWQFIKNHDSMITKVIYEAPSDDQLHRLLQNPEIKQEVVPYFMTRIVDVAAFLKQYPFQASTYVEECFLHITDEHAPWNNGTFKLAVNSSGSANVEQTTEEINGMAPEQGIACDIQTLSTMLLGYQRPSFLHRVGRLQGKVENIEIWESLIPRKTTCLLDYF